MGKDRSKWFDKAHAKQAEQSDASARLDAALDELEMAGEQRGLWSATKDKRHAAYGGGIALARSAILDAVEDIVVLALAKTHIVGGRECFEDAPCRECKQGARRLVRGKDG